MQLFIPMLVYRRLQVLLRKRRDHMTPVHKIINYYYYYYAQILTRTYRIHKEVTVNMSNPRTIQHTRVAAITGVTSDTLRSKRAQIVCIIISTSARYNKAVQPEKAPYNYLHCITIHAITMSHTHTRYKSPLKHYHRHCFIIDINWRQWSNAHIHESHCTSPS